MNRGPRLVSRMKSIVVPAGRKPRTVLLGPSRGIRMELDLRHQTQLCLGLYEREILGWIKRLGQQSRTMVDVGSGEGIYPLYFLAKTRVERVFAFEPQDEARALFRRNLDLNGFGDDSRLRLSASPVGAERAPTAVTLDDLLGDLRPPCLVKIDVDGSEMDVLSGSSAVLDRTDVSWIVEVHSSSLAEGCKAVLRRAGLIVFTVPNAWWRILLPEMRPIAVNHWLVAVPPQEVRSRRLRICT